MTERLYFTETASYHPPENNLPEVARYHREAAEVYRKWAENAPFLGRENYSSDKGLPDPEIFGVPGKYGKSTYADIKLPDRIFKQAKKIDEDRWHYFDNCFCEANPELRRKFKSTEDFYNHQSSYNNEYVEEVFAKYSTRLYETREDYSSLVGRMADLVDNIASFLETRSNL